MRRSRLVAAAAETQAARVPSSLMAFPSLSRHCHVTAGPCDRPPLGIHDNQIAGVLGALAGHRPLALRFHDAARLEVSPKGATNDRAFRFVLERLQPLQPFCQVRVNRERVKLARRPVGSLT
jgi:hypothetical protein